MDQNSSHNGAAQRLPSAQDLWNGAARQDVKDRMEIFQEVFLRSSPAAPEEKPDERG